MRGAGVLRGMEDAHRALLPRAGSLPAPVPGCGPPVSDGAGGRGGVQEVVAFCLLAQPELAVGAVVVIGAVIVASAIAEEIAKETAAERRRTRGSCACRCFGPWTPTGDPNEGDPEAGQQAHDAECRSECVYRGFLPSNYTCR